MSDAAWLMTASAVAWLGIGAYLLHLARRTGSLEARLRDLEEDMEAVDSAAPAPHAHVKTVSSPLPDANRDGE